MLFNPRTLSQHYAAILDLDGTIADNKHRMHLLPKQNEDGTWTSTTKDWDRFHSELHNDGFDQHVYNMYCYLCGKYPTVRRIVLSGRNENNRFAIIKWLSKYNVDIDELYLRGNNDYRPAPEFKMEVINKLKQEGLKIAFAFEDEIKNCNAFVQNGIYTYKVTLPGNIETYELEK